MPYKRKAKDAQASSKDKAKTTDTTTSASRGQLKLGQETTESSPLTFDVAYEGKSIMCQKLFPKGAKDSLPQLIFTHGAGGGIESPATKCFAEGFAEHGPVVLYQGTMNLTSRVKMFVAVIEDQGWGEVLGGRSMGARAAVMAAKQLGRTKSLVLVSYPLTSPAGEVRDQILLDVDEDVDVLFVVGDKDSMCDLDDLQRVRGRMKAKSWLVVVEGADHGMSVGNKTQMVMGRMAAEWVKTKDESKAETRISKNLTTPTASDSKLTAWLSSSQKDKTSEKDKGKSTGADEVPAESGPRKRRKKT